MDRVSVSNEIVTRGPTTVNPIENFFLNLSGGQRNRILRYLNNIHSNFQILVEELGHLNDKIPQTITRLESIKDSLDKWHRGTNLLIAGGATASAIGGTAMLFAMLSAPVTGGASLGLALTVGGSAAAIGGMVTDERSQCSSRNQTINVVEEVEAHYKKAGSAYKEFKQNTQLLFRLVRELNPSLRSLNEDEMDQLSINFASSRLFQNISINRERYLSVSAGAALTSLPSLNALSKSSTSTITTANILFRAVTKTVKKGGVVRSVGTVALKNPVVTNAGTTVIQRSSLTAVNQGTKVFKTTTTFNKVGVTVLDAGDITITKVSQLKACVNTTTKELAPVLSKVGFALTTAGIIFDVYTAYKAFSKLINDEKCDTSKQIADHIERLREIKEQIEQAFDQLQAIEDEKRALEN